MNGNITTTIAATVAALAMPLLGSSVRADGVSVTFSSSILTVTPGETDVAVFGTITDIAGDDVFLNSDNLTVPNAATITDDFLSNAPAELTAGTDSGMIELFSFDVAADAPVSSTLGSYAILGGIGDFAEDNFDTIGAQTFTVDVVPETVTAVFEPGSWILLATGLGAVVILGSRRRSARFDPG